MCGREMLAKLTAKAVQLNGGGRGGLPDYAGCEVAGLLQGLGEEATALALYRYCGHVGLEPALFYLAWVRVADLATREGWSIPRGELVLRKLTKVALFELVLGNGVCSVCHGNAGLYGINSVTQKPEYHECVQCRGTGKARLTAMQIARAIGRSEHQYHATWKGRYLMIADSLYRWQASLEVELDKVFLRSMQK